MTDKYHFHRGDDGSTIVHSYGSPLHYTSDRDSVFDDDHFDDDHDHDISTPAGLIHYGPAGPNQKEQI